MLMSVIPRAMFKGISCDSMRVPALRKGPYPVDLRRRIGHFAATCNRNRCKGRIDGHAAQHQRGGSDQRRSPDPHAAVDY